ncbi:MAG: siderophore-interacting protein [Nocardioidaceae bacterium]|nr:siderophore-interacting protein [Nocardioidaceae bacterium]MCL2611902.1 siderophore-interacting protein [Nocardioidaceae bacterium]
MSRRAEEYAAQVLRREELSDHFVRLTLGGEGLAGFVSTGIPDEWVGLVVPGQFQSRYYTVRSWSDGELVVDVVVHEVGLVTEWALGRAGDPVGQTLTITEPKSSFALPDDAGWLQLVGDLTAMPAMARIAGTYADRLPVRVHAEVPDDPSSYDGYLPGSADVTWARGSGDGLAAAVEALELPEGAGYFWMAGESAQMRAIRKHLMREVRMPSTHYDVMGYWRKVSERQLRAVDPGPIWRAGKAQGKSDEEIWAAYDAARAGEQQ